MPPDIEESPEFREWYSRTFAGQMEEIRDAMNELHLSIMRTFGIPASIALQQIGTAMRSDMPEDRLQFPNPYWPPSTRNTPRFPTPPYRRTEFPDDPAATQESTADPDLLNRVRGVIPPMRHDLRRAEGLCGRCSEPALSRCYTIGCHMQGVKMCAKHMTEDHDGMTLPEGVPHE